MSDPRRIPIEDHIDLHAFLPREIPQLLEDYLEEAARAGFGRVRIIHGRGTGTLRQAVRIVLSRHPMVETCADAPPEAGGWGATVATLRARKDATSGR